MRERNTAKIEIHTTPTLRHAAKEAADELGIALSEYIRLALINLVNEREIPFKIQRSGARRGRPFGYSPKRETEAA